MDTGAHYAELIKARLAKIAALSNRRVSDGIETLCVFDDDRGHYLLIKTGWSPDRRARGATLFLRVKDGKIWIEEDWTEEGLAPELVQAGVRPEDIVLAFKAPEERHMTGFAVA